MRRVLAFLIWFALVAGACAFYYAAAAEHARRVNTSRVRADQSGYLWDAVAIHQARHGGPDVLIGERNRMPLYPWLLSWLYDPRLSPDEFFAVAKTWNIRLSLLLLAIVAVVARSLLPPLPAANLVLAMAFGYFVFKAGYAQVELLFYVLFLLAFLAACRMLASAGPWRTLAWAALAGVLAALGHLSKAAMLPFAALVLLACGVRAAVAVSRSRRDRPGGMNMVRAGAPAAAAAVFLVAFLAPMSPYLANSKRVFGHYFYNVNSTFYVWYDDWPAASQGTYQHGDGVGWPKMPPERIPTFRTYLRDHSVGQIAGRIGNGLLEMVTVSYTRLWYFKWVLMYLMAGAALIWCNRGALAALVRSQPALCLFVLLYGLVYLLAVAFYQPISGTTLRMLLAHVAPLLFAVSWLSAQPPFAATRWQAGGVTLGTAHFHLLVFATAVLDVIFVVWPRVMSDFAGY